MINKARRFVSWTQHASSRTESNAGERGLKLSSSGSDDDRANGDDSPPMTNEVRRRGAWTQHASSALCLVQDPEEETGEQALTMASSNSDDDGAYGDGGNDRESFVGRCAFSGSEAFVELLADGSNETLAAAKATNESVLSFGAEGDEDNISDRPRPALSRLASSENTYNKIRAWHERHAWRKTLELLLRTPQEAWLSSFCRCDPRRQIMKFFNEVAREGGDVQVEGDGVQVGEGEVHKRQRRSLLADLFDKGDVFTVWRHCPDMAIKNMMLGIATGKGMEIKGKSARRGNISSYVPFIQIYEDDHKEECRALLKNGNVIRVFYPSAVARNVAHKIMLDVKHVMHDDPNLLINFVNTYIHSSPPLFGLDIDEALFWETYVINQDCSRPAGTQWDIGRNSQPILMGMNLKALRLVPTPGERRVVVYQKMIEYRPLEPRTLLMAYEQDGGVKPVVSDFDCFLLGSRGVKYKNPVSKVEVELLKWTVRNIGKLLDERSLPDSSKADWTETWLRVHKKAIKEGYEPKMPSFGFGDPKSYEITRAAVSRLKVTGCVRHGAECFNWFFPQEMEDKLLVISNTLPGNVKWKTVNVQQLQDLLISKIDEGFTFPINPKWVLCDPGWRKVYDKLLASEEPHVQDSINCWLPPGTGLREEIDAISYRHPAGFEGTDEKTEGRKRMHITRMEMARDELESLKVEREWKKTMEALPVLRLVWFWIKFMRMKRQEREERKMDEVQRSMIGRISWSDSSSNLKIRKWHIRKAWKNVLELLLRTRPEAWLNSFCRGDPRRQIMKVFDQVAIEEGEVEADFAEAESINPDANVFTVWRPSSREAIKNMMLGVATGKGLDIKGKSAKCGNVSSFVPFIQIHEEAHKEECRSFLKSGGTVRVYFQSALARNEAYKIILKVKGDIEMRKLSAQPDHEKTTMEYVVQSDPNLRADFVNTYIHSSPPVFGLDINEVLFWETYVIKEDCSRPTGTQWDIGRKSDPAFMEMNLKTIRLSAGYAPLPGAPRARAAVYQMLPYNPLEPRTLLMAYEEYPSVKPVVSDFDCFLFGSRGIKYRDPIPQDQMKLLKWMVKTIHKVLDERSMPNSSKTGWMETWFNVLKKAIEEGSRPVVTQYRWLGDPKSSKITRAAVARLKSIGCVRHGAECFNWYFPQEIDEQLLVISNTLPGNIKWKMMNVSKLQDFLTSRIEEGFTFPMNPKWVLCDPGWRAVYERLLASQEPYVQDSINCWLPPGTGLREEIDAISYRHPAGFEGMNEKEMDTDRMFAMRNDLKNLKIQIRWRKLRLLLVWFRFMQMLKQEKKR